MTAVSQPKRHSSIRHTSSEFFHHSHSRHPSRSQSPPAQDHPLFEGTDAISQNRKVAVSRIVEIHDALELSFHNKQLDNSDEPPLSPLVLSSDEFTNELDVSPYDDAELRVFRYFLRLWDPSVPADPEFDATIAPRRAQFEEHATKHFIRRIALWDESEDVLEKSRNRLRKEKTKEKVNSALGKLWMVEKQRQDHNLKDELKEVTTKEGLAQLLWTLFHDNRAPLTPEFFQECQRAVKEKYGIKT